MPDGRQRVLFKTLPKRKELRHAVATIIRALQLENDLTDEDLAQEIGVSAGTVRNARNEDADLNALTIAAIGARFGSEAVQPYASLMHAQLMPQSARDTDPVPMLANAIGKLSVIRGGKDRLDAVPAARAARDALNHFITSAEVEAA